jgi:hypothetical protein
MSIGTRLLPRHRQGAFATVFHHDALFRYSRSVGNKVIARPVGGISVRHEQNAQ